MSVFGSIMSRIFGGSSASAAQPASPAATPSSAPAEQSSSVQATPAATASAPTPAAPAEPVDVAAVLTGMAEKSSEKLDWQHSIVDLMKLLGLDSSLSARKELASELHYPGDTNDSANMNVWLQKQVMQKLAENGGKVPAELHS